MLTSKLDISEALVINREISELQDVTRGIDLPKEIIHDNVIITPSYMKFKDAIEGITLRECLIIRNIGKKSAFIRIHEPNSIALKIKTLKHGIILSPGLSLKRWVTYSYKQPALLHALIPIEINKFDIDYQVICIFNIEYIKIEPISIDFGAIDIGCSSGIKLLTIKNIGGKSTRFKIDLGSNDMDINIKPHRGVVRPRSILKLYVRIIGINEGTFSNEFWIKSTPNIRVPVKAKIIMPRLEINYPNTTGDFTLVDFSSTFFQVKKYDTLTLKNISSQFSSFVVLAEIKNQLIPIQEVDVIKYPEFEAFNINPVEGRLESFHTIDFFLSFYPTMNLIEQKNRVPLTQDFMIFIRIVRVHCTEVEDILRAEKRNDPKPDDPPLHKIHIQDGSILSSDSSTSTISLVHRNAELVRLCLHGEAELPHLRFLPNEMHIKVSKFTEALSQTIHVENLSEKLSVTISFVKNGLANCIPAEIQMDPQSIVILTIKIPPRKHGKIECSFNLYFNAFINNIDSTQKKYIRVKISEYSVKCFLKMDMTKIIKSKSTRNATGTTSHFKCPCDIIEIEKCKPLTLKSLGLINISKLQEFPKSIDTTTIPLSPLQIYRVKVSPSMFSYGSVAQRVSNYQELTFYNENKFPVKIRLSSLSRKNINFLSGDLINIKSNQSATKLVEFRGDQIGKFYSYIDYMINDHHTYELSLTADVNYKYLTLSTREIIVGSDYLRQESYRPLESYLELKNKLNAKTKFKWKVPTTASYIVDPLFGTVRENKNLWIIISHISDFIKSDQTETVMICEGGHQVTLRLNKILPILKVALINDVIDVGEIGLNLSHKVKSVLHNAGNTEVLFQIDSMELPHGCDIFPQRGIISSRGITIIIIKLKFRACMKFMININVVIQKKMKLTLKIKGEVTFPKIKFIRNNIDIGRISAASYQVYKLSAINNGNVPVILRFPLNELPEFTVSLISMQLNQSIRDNITIVISPGVTQSFYLHFQPVHLSSYEIYLPIIINDILGPVIFNKSNTLQPIKYLQCYETFYNDIDGIKLNDIPSVMPTIYIHGTVIGEILTYNKLRFNFDAENNLSEDVLKIFNNSILNTPFIVHIDILFTSNSPFSIEWDSGKEPERNTDGSFTCCLLPKNEIIFRIIYKPIDSGLFTGDIAISAIGEYDAKMFSIVHLEGNKSKPSIVSDINEIFFNPIPLMIESENIFHINLYNFRKNTVIVGDIELPQAYSGTFTKSILSITFPDGNLLLADKSSEKMPIRLSLRSKYSVSFRTRIAISDENNEVISHIIVCGTVDNCLLSTHAYSILANGSRKINKGNHYDIQQLSYQSLYSELSDNDSKIHINHIHSHINNSQPRLSICSRINHNNKSPNLKSSLANDDIDDEMEISVINQSNISLTSPEIIKSQQRLDNYSCPFVPDNFQMEYEQHIQRTINAAEKWMFSGPLKFQFNPDIPDGITAVLSGVCSIKQATSDKRKIHTVDKSFLDVLAATVGQEIHNHIDIPKILPVDNDKRINLILKTYDDMLSYLLSVNAHVSYINSIYLLNYDDYCNIIKNDKISRTAFDAYSKQSWLDVILQTYKQFVLLKIKLSTILNASDNDVINQSIDIICTLSSTNCMELLTERDINIITERANDKDCFDSEAILLAWLEYHYEQQCKEDWLNNTHKTINFMEEIINIQRKIINNFDSDLMDSLVLITVTASHCPYLIDEYFRNIYINPKSSEEYLHNAICVVRAWRKIRLGFIITPQEIIRPNSVQMLMLIVHLFNILPTYLPRNKVKFSCPLSENIIRNIGFNNNSDSPVSLIVEFFNNSLELFSIDNTDSIININSYDSKTINVKYHARKINKARVYLLLCGSAIGPYFSKNYCIILEGNTNYIGNVNEYKIKTELYCIVDKFINIKVPYKCETDYDIWITEEKPEKESSIKMIRWSELRKKKVPRRLFINQKTLSVIKNAHKANLSITLACMAPNTRTFWIIFQAKLGDFVIQITSSTRSLLTEPIIVQWDRKKCICTLPKILDCCPLNVNVNIPSRNVQFWNCVSKMFQKCLDPREQKFWSRQLDTNIGLKLIHWLMESHDDNTAKEFYHIFNKSVDYTVTVLDNKNYIIFSTIFNIPDIGQQHKNTEMKIHLSETLSKSYSTIMTLISRDEREQRNYNITLISKN